MSELMERYEREKAEKLNPNKTNCISDEDEEVEIDRYTAEKQFNFLGLMVALSIGAITIMGYMSR